MKLNVPDFGSQKFVKLNDSSISQVFFVSAELQWKNTREFQFHEKKIHFWSTVMLLDVGFI